MSMLNKINVDNFTSKNYTKYQNKTLGDIHNESNTDGYSISKLKQQKLNRLSITNNKKWQTNGFNMSSNNIA